jgi:hypothetical protein
MQRDLYSKWSQPTPKIRVQLPRQDLCRCHDSHGVAALEDHDGCSHRNEGLAGTDVSLQQTPHWHGPTEVGSNLTEHLLLGTSEREAETGKE